MPGCCSPFVGAANQQFNQKKVAQELERYRAKGPGPTTLLLADGIAQSGTLSGTVLDVGSGIGGLTFALLSGVRQVRSPSMRRPRTSTWHARRQDDTDVRMRFDLFTPISSRQPPICPPPAS